MTNIKKNGAYGYALLMFSVSFYSLGYAYELLCTVVEEFQRALRIQYIGIPLFSAAWVIFASGYTGRNKQKFYPFLFVVPLITYVLFYTSSYHNLYYTGFDINYSGPFPTLVISRGPWYIFNVFYSYIMILYGNVLFLMQIRRTKGSLRMQAIMLFSASLLPLIGNAIYMKGLMPMGLDITPLCISVLGPLYLFSMSRYGLFALMPIALRTIFEEMKDPIFVLDNDKRVINYNKAALSFVNFSQNLKIGNNISCLIHNYPTLREVIEQGIYGNREIVKKSKVGETSFYKADFTPLISRKSSWSRENTVGFVLTLYNITSEKELILSLNKQATTDELTGISNRRNFTHLAKLELSKASRYYRCVSLLILDIDYFKKVNDQYGHQAGDMVLVEVVNRIKMSLRPFDLFGRFGGEEFIILLPETDHHAAALTAERIRETVENLKVPFRDHIISVTLSVGITSIDNHQNEDCSFDRCVHQADKALYEAKNTGRNSVHSFMLPQTE